MPNVHRAATSWPPVIPKEHLHSVRVERRDQRAPAADHVGAHLIARDVEISTEIFGMSRCGAALLNVDEFQAAFGLKDGAPFLRPQEQRARIW